MERNGLSYEHFCLKIVKNRRAKKSFFSLTFFTFEVPFNGFFAPTSQSRMSNIFWDSESLGKSNGKKWSNIWTFLFGSGLKSPCKKNCFFCCWFCLGPPSYGIGATIGIGREIQCLPYAGFFLYWLIGYVGSKLLPNKPCILLCPNHFYTSLSLTALHKFKDERLQFNCRAVQHVACKWDIVLVSSEHILLKPTPLNIVLKTLTNIHTKTN